MADDRQPKPVAPPRQGFQLTVAYIPSLGRAHFETRSHAEPKVFVAGMLHPEELAQVINTCLGELRKAVENPELLPANISLTRTQPPVPGNEGESVEGIPAGIVLITPPDGDQGQA